MDHEAKGDEDAYKGNKEPHNDEDNLDNNEKPKVEPEIPGVIVTWDIRKNALVTQRILTTPKARVG